MFRNGRSLMKFQQGVIHHVSGSLTDEHILDLSERITSESEFMYLGIKVLGFEEYVMENALGKKKEIPMATREVLSMWMKKQNSRQEAYKNLYTALGKHEMNHLAAQLKQWVEGTAAEIGQTLGNGEYMGLTTTGVLVFLNFTENQFCGVLCSIDLDSLNFIMKWPIQTLLSVAPKLPVFVRSVEKLKQNEYIPWLFKFFFWVVWYC